jgi:predicted Zn-dependent peptidase
MKSSTHSQRSLSIGLLVALCLPASQRALAQSSPQGEKGVSISKVERKNKAPVSKEILKVKLPKPTETTLPNGLTVMILENHHMPTVTVALSIAGAGGLYEPAGQRGLAGITAQMLREGTKTRTSKQISEDLDALGASLFAGAPLGSSATTINVSGLSENFDDWFALFSDVLMNANFPADELAKLKQRQLANLRQQRASPNFLANERFNLAIYGSHPASATAPTAEVIQSLTPEALAKWKQERYAPQNAILGISGDVRAADLAPKVAKWLGGWQKSDAKETLPPNPHPATAGKVYLVDRPNSVQTILSMGNIAIDRRDPDYPALTVLNQIFGSGPASRLFLNIREEKGYTYGVYSNFTALKYPGPWTAGGSLRTEVTEPAMTEFVKEIKRIRDEKVPESELDEARRAVVAGFALSLEQPAPLLNYATIVKIYGFPADYWDTYPAKISAVTADDVQRVAKKYFDPATMQVVAVGDASKIKTGLEKFGPVEVYGADGKPVVAKAPAGNGSER